MESYTCILHARTPGCTKRNLPTSGRMIMNPTISFPFMNNGILSRMFFLFKSPIQRKSCFLRKKITSVFQRIASYLENNSLECTNPYEASYIPQSPKITTADAGFKKEAAFLLDTYGNRILRLAYSYLHNEQDAEEVLQDTLLKYLQAAPAFESDEHQKARLLRVAANLSKNRITYNKIRRTDELDETLIAEEREDLSFVWEAIKQLPEKYREVIHLYYYEGYSTVDIARILGRKESTIRSDLRRGREQLKITLKEVYDFA